MKSKLKRFLMKFFYRLKIFGFRVIFKNLISKIFVQRVKDWSLFEEFLEGKCGLEIGGPSRIFSAQGNIPVYSIVGKLDGCNFSNQTVWEGSIQEGETYQYQKGKVAGHQFVADAIDLNGISSNVYDFILSCHALEHMANPFKALTEWLRILKEDGILLLVVPHKDGTFDHKRPVTKLTHLIESFKEDLGEEDLSHLEEILELHDLKLDLVAGSFETFKKRSKDNFNNRCLHQHVFDISLVLEIFDHFKLQIICAEAILPNHIIVMGIKVKDKQRVTNADFMSKGVQCRRLSPFRRDRS